LRLIDSCITHRHLRRQLAQDALAQLARVPVPSRAFDVQPVDVRPWFGIQGLGFGVPVPPRPFDVQPVDVRPCRAAVKR